MGHMSIYLMIAFMVNSPAVGQPRKPATNAPATAGSSYAGQEKREIKALSDEDTKAYENGEGMGFAKAAELNHYPGPKHVLDAAAELGLTADQKGQTQKIYNEMHEKAVRTGRRIVEDEGKLDDLFSSGTINPKQLDSLTAAIAASQGGLRAIHLGAHLAEREVLTPSQIRRYDELRGYIRPGAHHDHMHHH